MVERNWYHRSVNKKQKGDTFNEDEPSSSNHCLKVYASLRVFKVGENHLKKDRI